MLICEIHTVNEPRRESAGPHVTFNLSTTLVSYTNKISHPLRLLYAQSLFKRNIASIR